MNRMRRWNGLPFTTVAAFLVAILLPLVWLVLAKWQGVDLRPSTDPLAFVTSVAALMGTVFVVGGLVIALASVVTLFDIDRRLEARVQALMPDIQSRADAQIKAYVKVAQAEGVDWWREADRLAREALADYPDVVGARRVAAIKISAPVLARFQRLHRYTSSWSITMGPHSIQETPLDEAMHWLHEAITKGEDTDGQLHARLALMHGVTGRYDHMLRTLQQALQQAPELHVRLAAPGQLIALAHACASVGQLRELGTLLDRVLPADHAMVVRSLENEDLYQAGTSAGFPHVLDWWVLERSTPKSSDLREKDALPGVIRFWRGVADDRSIGVRADYHVAGEIRSSYGPEPSATGPWPRPAELVDQLLNDFVFICDAEGALGMEISLFDTDSPHVHLPGQM